MPNLDRIKQAFWDAFRGTAAAAVRRARPSGGLKFRLDEVGWQVRVVPAAAHAYEGSENVPTTDEDCRQAQIYGGLIRYLALRPERPLGALLRDHRRARSSSAGRRRCSARTAASGPPTAWSRTPSRRPTAAAPAGYAPGSHTQTVVGARSFFPRISRRPLKNRTWTFKVRAEETASYRAGVFRLKSPSRVDRKGITRSLAGTGGALRETGVAKAYWTPVVKLPARTLKAGWYVYGVRLAADVNAKRTTTFIGRPFRVA